MDKVTLLSRLDTYGKVALYFMLWMGATACAQKPPMKTHSPTSPNATLLCTVSMDSIWLVPERGSEATIRIVVTLQNNGPEAVCLQLLDALRLDITTEDGQVLPEDGGRDGITKGDAVSEELAMGQSVSIDRSAQLSWQSPDQLRLQGDDGWGGIWYVDGLLAGKYALRFHYSNHRKMANDKPCIWLGEASSTTYPFRLQY